MLLSGSVRLARGSDRRGCRVARRVVHAGVDSAIPSASDSVCQVLSSQRAGHHLARGRSSRPRKLRRFCCIEQDPDLVSGRDTALAGFAARYPFDDAIQRIPGLRAGRNRAVSVDDFPSGTRV